MIELLKLAGFCLVLWGAITWLGTALVALGIAVLSAGAALLALNSSNSHSAELQEMRERLTRLEQNLNSAYERNSESIDEIRDQNRRLSDRLESRTRT